MVIYGRSEYAHRLVYQFANGVIPDDWHVHHRCETPACINPAHLEAMSPGDHHSPSSDRVMTKRRYNDPYHDPRWPALRLQVLARDLRVCQIRGPRCLGTANVCDHIISWKTDGAWFDPANLRAACKPCNNGRLRTIAVDRSPPTGPSRNW